MSNPTISAEALVAAHGTALVGRWVETQPHFGRQGGRAKVLSVNSDSNSPEIVMRVWLPVYGEIGLYYYENVSLV